jgi:hypothetical protein
MLSAVRQSGILHEQVRLIIFFGTPHRGRACAGWGRNTSYIVRFAFQDSNEKIFETLEVNSEVLDNIHEDFEKIAFNRPTRIYSFRRRAKY